MVLHEDRQIVPGFELPLINDRIDSGVAKSRRQIQDPLFMLLGVVRIRYEDFWYCHVSGILDFRDVDTVSLRYHFFCQK